MAQTSTKYESIYHDDICHHRANDFGFAHWATPSLPRVDLELKPLSSTRQMKAAHMKHQSQY
jgi:hypothetical protein